MSDAALQVMRIELAVSRDTQWRPLFRVGAVAAVVMVVLMATQMVCFFVAPPPSFLPDRSAVLDWYALFAAHPLLALVHLDLLMLVDFVMIPVLFLALWIALRRARPVTTAIALVFAMISTAVYLGSNPAFTMMSLADRYHTAASSELVAAGQSALAVYHGTPFDAAYVLSAIAGLLMCSAMIGSGVFRRWTAYVGIGMYALNLVPATAGTLGLVLSLVTLPPLAVWLVLVALDLRRM